MARNRKKHAAITRLIPAIKLLMFCLLIGGSGIGFVWQKQQIHALGREIKEHETELEELRRKNKKRQDDLAYLESPRVLDAKVRQLGLNLIQPDPADVLRLWEPKNLPDRNIDPSKQFARRKVR